MKLFYYQASEGNFGDDLNKWLWEELLPGNWSNESNTWFSGIGTILAPWMPRDPNWVIFTSGTGYGAPSIDLRRPSVHTVAVRGPLTATVLNLPPSAAVTDGAILLSHLERFKSLPSNQRAGVTFIPHRSALGDGNWQAVCQLAGVSFVDPRSHSENVIDAIRKSKLVLADSMHAAIIADTLRVPWIPISTSMEINSFKWLDWAQSMAVPYKPEIVPPSTMTEAWKNAAVRKMKRNIRSTGNQVEDALRGYAQAIRYPDKAERIYESRLFRASLKAVRAISLSSTKERYLDAAAWTIQKIAEKTPYLSEDLIFRQRAEEVNHRLGIVSSLGCREVRLC